MRRSWAPDLHRSRAAIWRRVRRVLPVLLAVPVVVVAVWDVAILCRMFWGQYRFPAELEWMEGGQLLHAYRLLHGQPLYGDCSDGFIPFPYPPGHPAVLAAVGWAFGLSFRVARILSITAFGLCCWLLGREVLKANASAWRGAVLALAAVAAAAVSYPVAGKWYDMARIDSVFLALLLGGAIACLPPSYSNSRRALGWWRTGLGAVLLTAAVYTKQSAVFFIPWICLFAVWRHWRSGLRLTIGVATLCAVLLGLMLWATEGRFWLFVFELMSRHPALPARSWQSAYRLVLFARFLPLLPLVALWLWHKKRLRSRTVFWLGMLTCALVASILTRAKLTAYLNNLMPAAVLSWPVAILLVSDLLEAMRPRTWVRLGWVAGLAFYATTRLGYLGFIPSGYLPSANAWRAARAFNRWVASLPGSVLVPSHGYIPTRQGRGRGQIHKQGWMDVLDARAPDFDFTRCLPGIRTDWLILDLPRDSYFDAIITTDYEAAEPVPSEVRDLPSVAHPDRIYRRKQDPPSALVRVRPRMLFDFEAETFAGWQQEGEAFGAGPSVGPRAGQWPILGHRGHGVANSFDLELGERARGTLRSEPFLIDRSHLGLRVGGGSSLKLRVELEIEGRTVRAAMGAGSDVDMLVPVVWDVTELESQRARIVIDDDEVGDWGHILVDEIELFDVADE
jgi:hypothetical protein